MIRRFLQPVLAAALGLTLTGCGTTLHLGYDRISVAWTFPERKEPPLPQQPSDSPPGKNPVLPAP